MIEMEKLIAKSLRDFKEGSIVKGRILEIRPREVLVDIGYKSEGVIPASEFEDIAEMQVGEVQYSNAHELLIANHGDTETRRKAGGEAENGNDDHDDPTSEPA